MTNGWLFLALGAVLLVTVVLRLGLADSNRWVSALMALVGVAALVRGVVALVSQRG